MARKHRASSSASERQDLAGRALDIDLGGGEVLGQELRVEQVIVLLALQARRRGSEDEWIVGFGPAKTSVSACRSSLGLGFVGDHGDALGPAFEPKGGEAEGDGLHHPISGPGEKGAAVVVDNQRLSLKAEFAEATPALA